MCGVVLMTQLKHKYISVCYGGIESYGGNQQRSSDHIIKKCGCGVVAAMDTLLYLQARCHWTDVSALGCIDGAVPIAGEKYDSCLIAMRKDYFPLLYPLGTSGLSLALGMNRFFRRHRLPFHGTWRPATAKIRDEMELMLDSDIPVVCAVGAKFPKFWEKTGLSLQVADGLGQLRPAANARAHFVTVTGMDNEWMQVSSWGRKYYVSCGDFLRYARESSNPLLCGILYMERK